jgi:ubiquinone/menaquinone biosynthesis C-methylase UbiE
LPAAASPFDAMAGVYDKEFTATLIGTMMRSAVWARCAARFSPGSRLLEMNCGTGEDALWLANCGMEVLATDISPAMLEVARNKSTASPMGASVRFQCLSWQDLPSLHEAPFDGALSNFGGLNCVDDLRSAASSLARTLRPGAVAILCVMGPIVPWEWFWYLSRGEPAKAFRRLRKSGTLWSGITIRYPSISQTRRAFAPEFRMLRASALGTLLPPPYTEKRLIRYPRTIATLNRIERRLEACWPLPLLADHYVLECQRL